MGDKTFGIDYDLLHDISAQVKEIHDLGVEVVIVIGAGNIWRGAQDTDSDLDRVASDYIGMLGTIMNSVALQASLEKKYNLASRVCSALDIPSVAEPYIKRRAMRHLEKGRVVICAAGTGNPYFTTDSAAALRSLELECDVLLKATNVDGVYSADPRQDATATRYEQVSYDEVLEKNLKVMDSTAIAQCRDNDMPLIVFEMFKPGNLKRVVCGENVGTRVK